MYIVIEGPDGVGKTTQAHRLLDELTRREIPCIYVTEPGGTQIGHELKRIIKDRTFERAPSTDLLLFTASRVEQYYQTIKLALESGKTVIADRNWLSSVAYQGVASGLGIETVVHETRAWLPEEYTSPTFTVILTLSVEQHQERLARRGTSSSDYFESQPNDFQRKLIDGYEQAAQLVRSERVSTDDSIEKVHAKIVAALETAKII